ncbi:mitochondrial ribosomal protein L15 isoform X2 [Brevipalpus obovatus]|uniref:mitochondrial ribosomal protein L15 isoform X2 n=1 Tax=Brevipalpus obovatus TaxID=246614 RepID=UPI003D9DDABD
MSGGGPIAERALRLMRRFPRITQKSVDISIYDRNVKKRSQYARKGVGNYVYKSWEHKQRFAPVGFVHDSSPFYQHCPVHDYYKDVLHRRSYPPMSLFELQLLIDTGKLDTNQPIDLTSLALTGTYRIDPAFNEYGVQLTDDGIDCFQAKINIEVQYASEQVISAIERHGGTITTAYYDIKSVAALYNPEKFFKKGEPIPKRLLPAPDQIAYYTDPKNRGYLSDPELIAKERFILAQKYGYELPDLTKDEKYKMLTLRKDPRQVFFGLEPGWLVNLKNKEILRPVDKDWQEFYEKV